MKINAKFLVVAFILAIFSVGVVAASEDVGLESSELTQVPHEQVVSVSEPTVPEVETTNYETSANDINNEISVSSDKNVTDSYSKESLKQSKKGESLLGASNDEEVLSATHYLSGNTFADLQNAINNAQAGDIIDLQGKTISGYRSLSCNKNIIIVNGNLDGNDYLAAYNFQNCKLENLTLSNFHMSWGASINYCTLNNVAFNNFLTDKGCTFAIRYCNLESVNFTNCHSLMPADPEGEDFETGVMIVTYGSNYNNCYFTNCSTNRHSGAICVAGSPGNTANITNCVFYNCSSGVGGAIYLHGTGLTENHHSNIINCSFIDCKATEYGGAIGSSQDYLNIENCDFYNNSAKKGGAIMVGGITHGLDGDNSEGHNNLLNNCSFFNNIATEEGGAVHITGDNNEAINCVFDDNFAHSGNGSAIYVYGVNASVYDSNFTNHDCARGTVYIYGENSTIQGSFFENNTASKGGAGVYIFGNNTFLDNNVFNGNNATIHGGAIHTHGNNAIISNSVFTNNNVLPNVTDKSQGLGGAIYIHGDNNLIYNSNFTGNTARNGSAIYNNGDNFTIENGNFLNNQAWSYIIIIITDPPSPMYYNETQEVKVNLTMIGGDNIINAIHNAEDPNQIYLYNVTYYHSTTNTTRTTSQEEIHPRDGVENSEGGKYIYQDDREDLQVINVVVTRDSDNKVILNTTGDDLRTGLYGNVTVTLDPILFAGNYTIFAEHPDDENYTAISNTTHFEILPHVDVSVTKTSNKDVYIVGEEAIFTIVVRNVGSNATNVTVRDILPDSLTFVSAVATQGTYDSSTNIWSVGDMTNGSSKTLTLTVTTTEIGSFDNVVNVTSNEKDWNLSNNVANKTIKVDIYYTKEANVTNTSAGEYFEYYLSVYNVGDSTYSQTLRIRDVLPEGVQYTGIYNLQGADLITYINYGFEQIWEITNISKGTHAIITIKVKALKDGVWNNTMYVWNFPPVNATVNVSSNADLRVIKEVSVKNTKNGDLINWTIFVKNEGPSIAMGAYVDDILPAGLEIYGMSVASKGGYDRDNGRWTIGDMAVGEIQTLTITTRVTVSNANITNEATVNSTTPDPNPKNNYDNETTEVTPEGDVGVEKTVSVHDVNHGQIVYWTIVVTNYGPDTATGVFVTDVLPTGLQYINSTKSKGKDYNPVTGNWNIGNLAKGENATLTIYTRAVDHNVLINNIATVNSTSIDTNPNNNKDDDYINIGPEADLELVKVVNKHEVIKGDIVIWTITVINHGPNDAIDAYVEDLLPKGLEFISSSSPRRYDNNTGRWDIGHLSNGSNATLTIVTRVLASNEIIKNYAITNSSTYDPDPYNNNDEDGITVKTEADVGIIKIVSNKTAHYGDTVIWTVNVTNYGPNVAENVVVTDLLPAGLIIIGSPSHSQGHVYVDGSGNGIWNIGNLAVNESVSAIINSKINTTDTTIINVVKVNTTSHDPNPSNDIAENRTVIPPEADVEVIKTVNNVTPNKNDTIVWTITVINHGPDVAENVIVTDILPAGVEYVSHQGSYHRSTGVWDVGSLAHKESKTLNITTKVVDTGKITNEVNVTTTTYDTDLTNNYDNETIDVPAIADLVITKEVSNKTPKFGDLINWTITVTNNGPNNARNVVVNDKLPKGLIYVTHNATKGLYDSVQGIWQIGDVLHFGSERIIITTRVNVTNTTITNVAVVTSTTPDSNETNNKANNTTTIGPVADVAIEKLVNNHGPKKGDNIVWTIIVTNNGPDVAVNAVATDVLPAGLIFVSATGDGSYDNKTNLWTIGDIENKATRVLYITTKVNVTKAVITNTVNVTSDTPDSDDSNNEDNETIDVGHETDLKIVKTVSNSTPKSGDEITWNITVFNLGPDDAIETVVNDKLPAGLIWIGDDSNGAYNHITGIWNIGTLAHHTNVTLLIRTLVNVSGVSITNIANVTTDTHDTNESNNEDNDTIDVPADPKADLSIVKEVSNKTPHKGDEITWTITVTNNGPDTAYNVTVTDKLPAGLVYKTDDSNGKYNKTTGIWTIGELANTKSVSLVITTLVNITNTTITNVANVTSTTPDPNDENNKANNNTTVAPEADLEIVKLVSNTTVKKGDIITWTIVVTNKGPDAALNVYVRDELPNGLILNGYSKTKGLFDTDSFTWFIPSLAKGESQNLTLRTLVNVTNRTLVNTANVTNDVYDPNKTNNEANNNTTVVPEADLEVIKTAMNSTVKKGDVLGWNITIINHGPDTVSEISIADKAQTGLIFVDLHGRLINGQVVTDKIKVNLQAGESMTIYVVTLVNASNVNLTNEVDVKGDIYDPNPENNYDNDTVEVLPRADIVVEKTVSSNVTRKGEEITWTITVTNNGPDTAVNTRVTDKLPKGDLIYNGHKADVGNYDPESGVWIVGDLASGVSKTLTIKTIVNITNKTIINVANVTSDTPGNKTNDTDNTTSEPKADLVVVKEVSNKNPIFGEEITWTVTVTNKGPDVAVNAKVTDKLPDGLIFVKSNGNYNATTGVWTVGDLANGESKSLVITTRVNITNATIENIANATSDTPGNNTPGNNTTDVGSIADLEVVKLVSNTTAKTGEIITWTIIVTNNGPDAAKNVNVTDKLPAGLTYKTHKADYGVYDPSQGIWVIGDMAKGQSYKLTINTIVDIVNGTIENVAVVNSSTPDNNTDNNKANNNTTVNENADLVIVKEVSNKAPHKGDTITWTVTVTNNGPSEAKNVKVTDKLPEGLVFKGSNGAYDPETGVWTVGDLANGKSVSLVITTIVNITNKTITNVANVTSDTPDSNKTNNEANNTTDVAPEADLEVIKTVSNSTPKKGDIIIWTIIVTNNGPDAAVNVRIVDTIPEGLLVVGDAMTKATKEVVIEIPKLDAGKSAEFTIKTVVNVTNATLRNVVVANSNTYDPNETNNKDNETAEVPAEADLEIIKLVSNSTAHKGDIIVWTVKVTNNGPDVAEKVYVNDILPNGLVYKAHNANKGLFDSNKLVWFIESLANGETQTLTIETLVNTTNTKITNIVNVTSDTPDSNKTNNVANNITDVPPEADIGVVKEVNATECAKDQIVEWKITMTNHGPDGATDVVVKDNLPDTLIFISADGNYNPETGIWTIDYLASGETRVLTIITKINTTGMVIVNNVTATSGVYDPDMSNNKASNNTTVVKETLADLVIVKEVSNKNPHKGDEITWTITVTNNGPDTAKDVVVSDKLPDGLIFKDANGNYNPATGVWTVGDLENGKSVSLIITTVVDITNSNVTNVAVVNSTTPDNNTDNNKDNDTIVVDPEADIAVIKTVSNPTPEKGDVITWTIVVTNFGPDAAKNVVVEETLPEGLQLMATKGSKGAYENGIWTVGDLNNQEQATLTLTTKVTVSGGTIENIVVASSSTHDSNKTNNRDKEVTNPKPVETSADLEITKVANVDKVKVGDEFIWIITVVNHGPDVAKNVRVTDWATGDFEILDIIVSKGDFDINTGIWTVGDMEDGETVTLELICKALSDVDAVNHASVESDTPDPNEDNNYDMSSVDVYTPSPDNPVKHSIPKAHTMHATGNPIVMVLLALLAIVGVTLRRKN